MRKPWVIISTTRGRSSSRPSVLSQVAGIPVILHLLQSFTQAAVQDIILILDEEEEELIRSALGDMDVTYICCTRSGSALDSLSQALGRIKKDTDLVLVLDGNMPFLQAENILTFVDGFSDLSSKAAILVTAPPSEDLECGDVLCGGKGRGFDNGGKGTKGSLSGKEEHVYTGIFISEAGWLKKVLRSFEGKQGTKIQDFGFWIWQTGSASGVAKAHLDPIWESFIRIETYEDLASANELGYRLVAEHWMEHGVEMLLPQTTLIDLSVKIEKGARIGPFTVIKGDTTIGRGSVIEAGVWISSSKIGAFSHIKPYSVLDGVVIGRHAEIGPFARLRPGSIVGENARIGNFVEVKNSRLGKGVKASHLSYIGDALVGEGTNVGCGTITCNYDGKKKHRTVIGRGVFVGSDVQFVAPVRVGNGAVIGAGSTITDNVPPRSLAIARARQVNIKGWVDRKRDAKG